VSENDNKLNRAADTNIALGAFILILGITVLTGTFFAEGVQAFTVNAIAGGILVATGAGFLIAGFRARKPQK